MIKNTENKIRVFFKKHPLIKYSGYIILGVLLYKATLEDLSSFKDVASTLAFVIVGGIWHLDKFEKIFEKNKKEIGLLKKQLLEASEKEQKLESRTEALESLNYKTISEQNKIKKRS